MIPITRPDLPPLEQYVELLDEIWQTRMLSNFSTFAQRVETISAEYLGVETRAVASGDIGLIVAIAALDLPPGASVIVPSFTFNSTVNAVLWNRLRPIFADIDPVTLNLDPASAQLAAVRHDAALIVATHVFGNPADVQGLREVADERGIQIVYDAAHAYGARHDGAMIGGFGDIEVFSLSGTKLVTSAEGGLIAARDKRLIDRIDYLRAYGFRNDYNSRLVGVNGKMSELHAALGTLTLPTVEVAVRRRVEIASMYGGLLKGLPISFQLVEPSDRTTYKDFCVLFEDGESRERVEGSLADSAVQTKRYFRPCHTHTAFKGYPREPLEVTDDVYERSLCLPMFSAIADEDLRHIAAVIASAVAR